MADADRLTTPLARLPLPLPRSAKSTAIGAYLEGWRRVVTAPFLVLGSLLVLGAPWLASPPAAVSTVTDAAASFLTGLLGFGEPAAPVVRAYGSPSVPAWLVWATIGYLGMAAFFSGGAIDRLARARPLGGDVFLATCGRHTLRLLRLGTLTAVGYWALLRWVLPWLETIVRQLVVGATPTPGRALGASIAAGVLSLAVLGAFTLVADFARVRMVVEDRFSALASWGAGWRFVRRRPARLAGLFLINVLGHAVLLRLWLQVSPQVLEGGPLSVALIATFVVLRTGVRLAFTASETVFFQGDLAHATYAAAPVPMWPDSASVEALRNLRRLR